MDGQRERPGPKPKPIVNQERARQELALSRIPGPTRYELALWG